MKVFAKFVGGKFNLMLILMFVFLTVIRQIVVEYENFSINFWKTLAGLLFVTLAVFVLLVVAYRLLMLIRRFVAKKRDARTEL